MAGGAEISLKFDRDPPGEPWFTVPLAVGDDVLFQALLNPGLPESLISPSAWQDLKTRDPDLVEDLGDRRYRLQAVKLQRQPTPDIDVVIGRYSTRLLGVDCILGFSFFEKFTEIRFFPPSAEAVLIDP